MRFLDDAHRLGLLRTVGPIYQFRHAELQDHFAEAYRRVHQPEPMAGARQVLERFRQAAIDQSADGMSRLYAIDAVHEFPFARPGVPSRLDGREEIVNFLAAGWNTSPLRFERYRTLAIHDTSDPDTIVVEQEVTGTSRSVGLFALPNIVVLTVHNGQITHLRDYVDVLAATEAAGRGTL
jgi:ketosteroid isomerase-like protein